MVAAVANELVGEVKSANSRGVLLKGEAEWANWSRWAEHVVTPQPGERVVLHLDGGGFIRSLASSGGTSGKDYPEVAGAPADRETRITRSACLNTATAIAASWQRPLDAREVMALAETLERWVTR